MAGRPLRPATHRRLGGPLPRQLSNGTQASLVTPFWGLSSQEDVLSELHRVLATVSRGYSRSQGKLPTCYSPVRRFTQDIATHRRLGGPLPRQLSNGTQAHLVTFFWNL